jgi:hypothetical protein
MYSTPSTKEYGNEAVPQEANGATSSRLRCPADDFGCGIHEVVNARAPWGEFLRVNMASSGIYIYIYASATRLILSLPVKTKCWRSVTGGAVEAVCGRPIMSASSKDSQNRRSCSRKSLWQCKVTPHSKESRQANVDISCKRIPQGNGCMIQRAT